MVLSTAVAALLALAVNADPARSATQSVGIGDNFFSPATVTIAVGDTVVWTNNSSRNPPRQHTVTRSASPGSFDSGPLAGGQTFQRTFTVDGTFSYVCSFHGSMAGTVIVGNGGNTTTTAAPTTTNTTQPPATTTPTTSGGGSNTTTTSGSSGGTATTSSGGGGSGSGGGGSGGSGGGGGSGSSTTKPVLTVTKGSVTRAVVTTPDGTPVTDPSTGDTVLGEVVTTVAEDSDSESAAGASASKDEGGGGSGGPSPALILLPIAAAIGGGLWWRRRSLPVD